MKQKKFLKILLCTLIAIALLSGCQKNDKPEVRLIIKTPPLPVTNQKNSAVNEACQLMEIAAKRFCEQYEKANVRIDVIKFDYVDEQKFITNCFDTENAADILYEGYFNMSSYIYSGRVMPLDDLLTDGLKEDFYFSDLNLGRVNGKTYMLPSFRLSNTLCYNKELFRLCGLNKYIAEEGKIANWSLNDWNFILDTLAKNLPDMTYPMMMYGKNNQGDTHIMTLLRSHGCNFFDADGYFCLNTPEGIAALQWIDDCNRKGYFPKGSENLEFADCMSLFSNGQLAIGMTNNASFPAMDHEKFGLVNFPGMNDDGISTIFVSGFMVFDNGDELKSETAKDFLRFFYRQEDLLDYEAVAIPSNRSVVERMNGSIYMLDAYIANDKTGVDFTANNPNWQGTDLSVRSLFWVHIHNLLSGDETPEECAKNLDRNCNAAIWSGRETGILHK